MLNETKKINGIVLKIDSKNNFDAIIKVLSIDKIYQFISKGFFKKTGKNNQNIFLGSISEFEFFLKYGKENIFLLKKANIKLFNNFNEKMDIDFYYKLDNLFQSLESFNKDFYNAYKYFLENQTESLKNYLLLYLTIKTLETKGQKLITNKCSMCNVNKNLYSIDLFEGGMLCFKHKTKKSISDLEYVKSFYFLSFSFIEYVKNTKENTNIRILKNVWDFYKN